MAQRTNDPILRELDALRDGSGRLRPQDVVEAARNPESVLHEHFEWDDDLAAESHRVNQARELIRSVAVNFVVREVELRSIAYVRDPLSPTRQSSYLRMSQVEPSSDLAREVVLQELARVASSLARARLVAQALDVVHEIDDLLLATCGLRADVASAEKKTKKRQKA
jgi:hypothetical protein